MRVLWLFLPILCCFGCLSKYGEPKTNNYIDDKVIAARVQQLLHSQADYKFPDIRVAVTNGAVHLNGSVRTADQKINATKLVEHAENVRSLKNNLTVKQDVP